MFTVDKVEVLAKLGRHKLREVQTWGLEKLRGLGLRNVRVCVSRAVSSGFKRSRFRVQDRYFEEVET